MNQAIDDLTASISDLGSGQSAGDTLTAIGTSLNDVVDSFDTLSTNVSSQLSDCELTTPSTIGN